MTDKSNDTPESNGPDDQTAPADQTVPGTPGSAGADSSASPATGPTATSPYDDPTGEFPPVRSAAGAAVPRTEDELGLDPDVPAAGATEASPHAEARMRSESGAESEAGATAAESASGSYPFATIPPAPAGAGENGHRHRRDPRRGTQDLGLLVLRWVLGLTFLYHGLQKLAGWFHGPGLDNTRTMLEQGGWKHIEASTAMLTISEVAGGALLVVGLATPLAAGAVLASIANAWLWKQGMEPGFQYRSTELEVILGALAAAVIFTGPGRLSFDRGRGWATRPAWGSFVVLILALAAAAAGWLLLHGGNPFVGGVDFGELDVG